MPVNDYDERVCEAGQNLDIEPDTSLTDDLLLDLLDALVEERDGCPPPTGPGC